MDFDDDNFVALTGASAAGAAGVAAAAAGGLALAALTAAASACSIPLVFSGSAPAMIFRGFTSTFAPFV